MNRQIIKPGQRIIHNFNRPLVERLKSRKHCGPYYVTPPNANDKETRMFYLDSDFMPSLRWTWCDEIARTIKHTGWYYNDFDETIRGLVFRLPHNRGFLAAYSMGDGMASAVDTSYIYDDEIDAALAADDMAKYAAERQREYEENQEN